MTWLRSKEPRSETVTLTMAAFTNDAGAAATRVASGAADADGAVESFSLRPECD